VTCGGSNAPSLSLACQNLKKKKEGKQQAARMTSENTGITIEDGNDKWQKSD